MLIRDYNISHNKNTMYTKFQRLRNMYKIVLLSQTSFNLLSYTIHLRYFTGNKMATAMSCLTAESVFGVVQLETRRNTKRNRYGWAAFLATIAGALSDLRSRTYPTMK